MSSEPEGDKTAAAAPKVVFKKVKSKNHCRRRNDDSDDDDSGNGDESLMWVTVFKLSKAFFVAYKYG